VRPMFNFTRAKKKKRQPQEKHNKCFAQEKNNINERIIKKKQTIKKTTF